MVKHFLFILAIVAMLCACSAEQLATNTTASNQIEIKAKLQLALSTHANVDKKKEKRTKTRAYFETTSINEQGESFTASYIKEGQPVLCVFRNKESNKVIQATTTLGLEENDEDTKTDPNGSGNKYNHRLTINKEFTFTANPEEDLTTGEWYVMCFVSNHVEKEKVHVDTPPHFHYMNHTFAPTETDPKIRYTPDVDIPFASLWQKVNVAKDASGKLVFTSDEDISMRMLGSLVNINIDAMPEQVKVHNFTLISSGDTKGYFNLTEENIKKLDLSYTAENGTEIDETKNEGYQKIIDLMWQGTSKKETDSQLSYTHYDVKDKENFIIGTLAGANDRRDVFWFAIKPSTRGEKDKAALKDLERYKTQFLLHATRYDNAVTRAGVLNPWEEDRKYPARFAHFPFYGSKAHFESGTVYYIQRNPNIIMGPLERMQKQGNYIAKDKYSKENNQAHFVAETELNNILSETDKVNYHIPTRFEWQTIFPRYMDIEDETPKATLTLGSMYGRDDMSPYAKFTQYFVSHKDKNSNKPLYTHLITLRKLPPQTTMGAIVDNDFSYNWNAEKATAFTYETNNKNENALFLESVYNDETIKLFEDERAIPLPTNESQHAIRIDYEDGKMKLTQRFLGNDFILDPFDIDTDAYWKYKSGTNIEPLGDKEMQRELPLWGYKMNSGSNEVEGLGTKAIYWSNTESKTDNDLANSKESNPNTRLPFYIDFSTDTYKWRTDNVSTHKDELYDGEKPKFKAILHIFKNISDNQTQ